MTNTLRAGMLRLLPALSVLLLACTGGSATAGPLKWQSSYAAALKEASAAGKPLLVIVGTDACHWCKQLEIRSLSDDGVAKVLNDRYVLYKIDADREAELATALKVNVYPSLYFASPRGSIVSYQEGFLEAGKLKDR